MSAPTILNLGCGTKTSAHPNVANLDWSISLRIRRNPLLRGLAPMLLNEGRLERYRSLPSNIVVHNLARGIPYDDGTVDAVYHSHLFEHLDRPIAQAFVSEVLRVLRPGGIHRIVVPDLETACRSYLEHLDAVDAGTANAADHDSRVAAILEQSVRREADGTSRQGPVRRRVENFLLGDARRRGETHQWMYDRVNLAHLLESAGYKECHVESYQTSRIPDWDTYGLDVNEDGSQYKPNSLYLEGVK